MASKRLQATARLAMVVAMLACSAQVSAQYLRYHGAQLDESHRVILEQQNGWVRIGILERVRENSAQDEEPGTFEWTDSGRKTDARFLIVSYNTDWLFPTAQSQQLVTALIGAKKHVSFTELESPFGHDSFLIGVDPLKRLVQPFLDQVPRSSSKS